MLNAVDQNLQSVFRIKTVIYSVFWFLIAVVWAIETASHYKSNAASYIHESGNSLEDWHSILAVYDHKTMDFYKVLRVCDRVLPEGASLRMVIPQSPADKKGFLELKGRYFLYPRNYGDNAKGADYILVYDVQNFRIPDGYHVCLSFSDKKYLLSRRSCPAGQL